MHEIVVRAMPAHGHEYRRRAGRAWGKQPITVKVVDAPKPHQYREDGSIAAYSDEISTEDYKELTEDQHLAVFAKGDPSAGDVLEAHAAIGERDKEILKLRKDLADAHESAELERKATSKEIEALGMRLKEAEAESDKLRAQLGKKKKD